MTNIERKLSDRIKYISYNNFNNFSDITEAIVAKKNFKDLNLNDLNINVAATFCNSLFFHKNININLFLLSSIFPMELHAFIMDDIDAYVLKYLIYDELIWMDSSFGSMRIEPQKHIILKPVYRNSLYQYHILKNSKYKRFNTNEFKSYIIEHSKTSNCIFFRPKNLLLGEFSNIHLK